MATFPGGAGIGASFRQHQRQHQQKRGCRPSASAKRLYLAPAPTPLHWLRPARSRKLLARSRARHLRPVRPPPGASLLMRSPAGFASPHPADASPSHRQAAERLAPR
nr:hypothetical protein [Pectobacterium carotovorum]